MVAPEVVDLMEPLSLPTRLEAPVLGRLEVLLVELDPEGRFT